MAVAVHIYSCLLAMTTLAAEPDRPIIDARAVLWPYRDSFSGDWMCDVLIKNLGDEIIEIPVPYGVQRKVGKRRRCRQIWMDALRLRRVSDC